MNNFDDVLKNLNSEQRDAIESIEGPVLVVAGPGTGKTHILALRIANILKKTDAKASDILCLTFTESGVTAMRNKLLQFIGKDAYYVNINTFHGFCNEVIQTHPEKFAFAKELIQLDDLNRVKFVQSILDSVSSTSSKTLTPFHNKYFYLPQIISSIQTLKREGISSDRLEEISRARLAMLENNKKNNPKTGKPSIKWVTEVGMENKNLELANIYRLYNEMLANLGYYDYEDMILFVIERFGKDSDLLAEYLEKYLYLLVDEYQDTNGSQNQILKFFGSFDNEPNIFAVGDDDQAIYRFQGANVENLLFFNTQFSNVKTIPITTNYRSTKYILENANSVIKNNKARLVNLLPNLSKELKPHASLENFMIEAHHFGSAAVENEFIVNKIKELKSKGESYSSIALLYRRHIDAEDIAELLLKNGIPYKESIGKNIFEEQTVKKLVNLLRMVNFEKDDLDNILFQVLYYDFTDLEKVDVFKVTRYFSERYKKENPQNTFLEFLLDPVAISLTDIKSAQKFNDFAKKIVGWKADSFNLPLLRLVEKIATESNLIKYVFTSQNVDKITSLNAFMGFVRTLNKSNIDISLKDFLEDLRVIEENKIQVVNREFNSNREAVNLLTAHASKGLQFKHVFIVKCFDGNWGGRVSRELIKLPPEVFDLTRKNELSKLEDLDFNLEDERRLFYVALTRAEQCVYITYSQKYPSGKSTKEVLPSQFIKELHSSYVEYVSHDQEELSTESIKNNNSYRQQESYSSEEKEFLSAIIQEFRLSPSALNEYIACPRRFKFERLLKVPRKVDKSLSLGTAVHAALESLMSEYKSANLESKEYLLKSFEKSLRRQILSKVEFAEILEEGKKILSDYYNFYQKDFIKPVEIEYGFFNKNILLSDGKEEPIRLTGKIDKIESIGVESKEDSGAGPGLFTENNQMRLVDYKTSNPISRNQIKGLTKNADGKVFRQLVFYKLLCELDQQFKPFVGAPKYQVQEVQVDFLKPQKNGKFTKEAFVISEDDVNDLKTLIFNVMGKIRNFEFEGSDEFPVCGDCMWCELST